MLLIYTPRLNNRIGYTLNLIFKDILREEIGITTDVEVFGRHDGAKLSYSSKRIADAPYVKPAGLLESTKVEEQELTVGEYEGGPMFFQVYGRDLDFPFDIFSAAFYLVSRYEEYMPHREDEHNRFDPRDSLAYRNDFLQTAVVDRWALLLRQKLESCYEGYTMPRRHFDFVDTIDIDTAYCYKHKGVFRTITAGLRDLVTSQYDEVADRLKTLLGRMDDPYDTFGYILQLRHRYGIRKQVFFALLADYSDFDKNNSYGNSDFRELLQRLADHAKLGVHTSYYSSDNPAKVEQEVERLSGILHRNVTRNRFHFLRFSLPYSYKVLLRYGIDKDYTMGYASEAGFRSGTCTPHHFFDLESDSETPLKVYPFAVMDATLCRHHGMTPDEAVEAFRKLIDEVKAVEGVFISIWHNESLSDRREWAGWRPVYEAMLQYIQQTLEKSDNEKV
ncbi:MAG: polysaccharide deacetylase family protein [Bacteroidales bacterium]|nr:polysaccharide deacetylase family protein [Bacteroidales bacterium]